MKEDEHNRMSGCSGTSAPIFEGRGVPHCSLSYQEQHVLLHHHIFILLINRASNCVLNMGEDGCFKRVCKHTFYQLKKCVYRPPV